MRPTLVVAVSAALAIATGSLYAGGEEAQKWIDEEFQPLSLIHI